MDGDDNENDNGPKMLKDGTLQLTCPMLNCNVKTFKLRRHMSTQHSHLIEYQIDYGMNLAKRMAKLDLGSLGMDQIKQEKPIKNFANKNDCFKECNICGVLVKNLTHHLKNYHKLSRNGPQYLSAMSDSKVIPVCYTKLEKGVRKELAGEEREMAENIYGNKIAEQRDHLEKAKEKKSEMQKIHEDMKRAINTPDYEELKKRLIVKEEEYKALRLVINSS